MANIRNGFYEVVAVTALKVGDRVRGERHDLVVYAIDRQPDGTIAVRYTNSVIVIHQATDTLSRRGER